MVLSFGSARKRGLAIATITTVLAAGIVSLMGATPAFAGGGGDTPHKAYVCKFVGTPGVDERLQTGQNPIDVDFNAIAESPVKVDSYFNDKQGRSYVLAIDIGQSKSSLPSCPSPTPVPPPVCANNGSSITQSGRAADLSSTTVTLKKGFSSCDVSLNNYHTSGPSWSTGNPQTFGDHATVHLTAASPTGHLMVTQGDCFNQNDLYIGTTRFDGTDGALPNYPNSPTPTNLVDHWNGGNKCVTPPPTSVTPTLTYTPGTCSAAGTVVASNTSQYTWKASGPANATIETATAVGNVVLTKTVFGPYDLSKLSGSSCPSTITPRVCTTSTVLPTSTNLDQQGWTLTHDSKYVDGGIQLSSTGGANGHGGVIDKTVSFPLADAANLARDLTVQSGGGSSFAIEMDTNTGATVTYEPLYSDLLWTDTAGILPRNNPAAGNNNGQGGPYSGNLSQLESNPTVVHLWVGIWSTDEVAVLHSISIDCSMQPFGLATPPAPKDATASEQVGSAATCDAPSTVTFSITNATWADAINTSGNNWTRTATANQGHQFADGSTSATVSYTITPKLTGSEACPTPTPTPTPSVTAPSTTVPGGGTDGGDIVSSVHASHAVAPSNNGGLNNGVASWALLLSIFAGALVFVFGRRAMKLRSRSGSAN